MFKRHVTPLSMDYRRKYNEKIITPQKKKYTSIEPNHLILPLLKENIDKKTIKSDKLLNNLYIKFKSPNQNEKNRVGINNILSPIKAKLNKKNKRNSRINIEIKPELIINSNEHKNKGIINKNSIEKNSYKNYNKFNKDNKNKNINNIKTEILPSISTSKSSSKVIFPLIEANLYLKNDKIINNNKKVNLGRHKYKSDTLLNSEYFLDIKKYATYTKKGIEEEGKSKENNQDISIILNDVCETENYSIFGIMDGHGSNGHLASNFVKEKIEDYFNDRKIYKQKKLEKSTSFLEITNSGKMYEKLINNNYEIIRNFYKNVNDDLYNTKFDVHFSGTTCVLVFKIGQKIICSNVGDSRAILVKKNTNLNNNNCNDNKYEFVQLSYDHKPNNKEERERIEKLGGEVAQEYLIGKENEPVGPFRVWNKGCDYPGIAISRSLGDKIAELIGVISDPDILEFDIDDNCKYIIMGSDGLFDHLSNDEIMKIAGPFLIRNNPDKACFDIVEKAAQLFKEKEDRVDDITINIIIL